MARINKFGRSDYIPEDIKLEVRKRCGFGCVNCGSPIYDYEHWNPEFKDLDSEPKADGITLCCPSCHRKKGGLLSMKQYRANIASPRAFKDGFVSTSWDAGFSPEILVGNVRCVGTTRILGLDNQLMLGFDRPEAPGAPPELIARFFNRSGIEVFKVEGHQCFGNPKVWDLKSTKIAESGWRWRVRHGVRQVDLLLELFPPERIVVRKMTWAYNNLKVVVNKDGIELFEYRWPIAGYESFYAVRDMTVRSLLENNCLIYLSRHPFITDHSRKITYYKHTPIMNGMELRYHAGGIIEM